MQVTAEEAHLTAGTQYRFNSLFEMRAATYGASTAREDSFNSLFEMPVRVPKRRLSVAKPPVSILYLRCDDVVSWQVKLVC